MSKDVTQFAIHLGSFEPATAKLGGSLRTKLRARLPGLNEIVYWYENQHALVISYSPTERGSEGVCGMKLTRGSAQLFFGQGALLSKSDPNRLLKGSGKTVRHVVLDSAADLGRPEIERLIAAALKLARITPIARTAAQRFARPRASARSRRPSVVRGSRS